MEFERTNPGGELGLGDVEVPFDAGACVSRCCYCERGAVGRYGGVDMTVWRVLNHES